MTDHPVLFSAEMVRAILAGRKTQTRRVIRNLQASAKLATLHPGGVAVFDLGNGYAVVKKECPYGWMPDRLWVRETWATDGNYDHIKPSDLGNHPHSGIIYRATEQYGDAYFKWRPSIHMPRWASRITLEVKAVRVERVQGISEKDAFSEGIGNLAYDDPISGLCMAGIGGGCGACENCDPVGHFKMLWDTIYEKRGFGWSVNPWVWVVEFSVI